MPTEAWTPEQFRLFEKEQRRLNRKLVLDYTAKRRPAPERSTHIAVADMLHKLARPDWFWTHIPSGEYRTEATGKLLKRMGLKPGIPDFLFIDRDGQHYWLELKRGKSARLTPEQLDFQIMCQARDIPHAVARSFAEAEAQLRAWGVLRPDVGAR